jgi:hypothetical protein
MKSTGLLIAAPLWFMVGLMQHHLSVTILAVVLGFLTWVGGLILLALES